MAQRDVGDCGIENRGGKYLTDLTEFEAMIAELKPLIDKVWRYCEDKGVYGRTVTLLLKFTDFELISRSRTVANSVVYRSDLANVTTELLRGLFPMKKSVWLLGVSVSEFVGEETGDPAQIVMEF
jgi:DNA polymerase IV